ncbi:galactinol synthase 2-like [Sesamum indicum]|uniref:Hexosyltransferase n=1 Tax=Sesamum indicum TaxID=4182 RepID=A0A6I9U148_SESIN|nr:galactinol synthase 2-like [Sesamum indicum]
MVPEIIIPTIKNAAEAARTLGGNNDCSCAYVTFLAGDGDYVKGVICLAKGLRKVKAAYPLVVAILPDVPEDHRNLLLNQGCLLREIEPVCPPVGNTDSQYIRAYFALNYCKLRLWEFVEYNKMIYLDADIQVFDNIDHLFDLPSGCLYAVMDCLCEMQGKPCADKVQWPAELGNEPPFYFNGGMFVFEPDLDTYNNLLSTLEITPPTPFAEQDYLNFFFKNTSRPIPATYNLLVAMLWRHPECVELDKVKVVHYCVTGSKPWKYTDKEQYMDREDMKMLIKRWWEIYNDKTLDFITTNETIDQVSG